MNENYTLKCFMGDSESILEAWRLVELYGERS